MARYTVAPIMMTVDSGATTTAATGTSSGSSESDDLVAIVFTLLGV